MKGPNVLSVAFLVSCGFERAGALQSLFPKQASSSWNNLGSLSPNKNNKLPQQARQVEDALIDAIGNEGSRLANSETISSLINQLESSFAPTCSVPDPAIAPQVYGRWRLIYTNNADTSSPIQRKAVDTQAFPIYQDILLNNDNQLLVNQVVQFSDSSQLVVSALGSSTAYPLPELTERRGTGKILGLNLLGVSLVGEEARPDNPNARIDFVFDEGNFDLLNGTFQLPYPVPFRLPFLRDLVKGWIDITWLSDRVRISRGNKGTTFVLIKEEDE